MWFFRTRPRLLRMFELVWGTADLITSFEGFSMFPPAAEEPVWDVATSWFHTDQNAASRTGLQTVQSLTSLFEQDEHSGGFVVLPRSWAAHGALSRRVMAARPETLAEQARLPSSPRAAHHATTHHAPRTTHYSVHTAHRLTAHCSLLCPRPACRAALSDAAA